jgi:hypothetical protein
MKHYCTNCGQELKEHQLNCPSCGHCFIIDIIRKDSDVDGVKQSELAVASTISAIQIEENTQWTKYHCGKYGLAGHGFAAEDANNLVDLLSGHNVEMPGRSNSKNGADRVVDGTPIQTKYCQNAHDSIVAAFDNETGLYRYGKQVKEGQVLKEQTIEVPKDQYDEAIEQMRKKIMEGKVPDHTDPDDAAKLVKRGSVTYRQSRNIAKAGNIDSLVFDVKSQTVSALSSFGISFVITSGLGLMKCHSSEDRKDVVQSALVQGLNNGTITMSSGVLNMQFIRTEIGRRLSAAVTSNSKTVVNNVRQTSVGKTIIDEIATTIAGRPVYGAAARNVVVKSLRTNIMGNIALTTIITIPDMYRCFLANSISKPQFIKNLVVNTTTIGMATLGTYIGSAFGKGWAIGGAVALGTTSAWAIKKIANHISKDDSEKMQQLISVALIQLSHDYMIQDENEFERTLNHIKHDAAITAKLLRAMYTIGEDEDNDELRVELAYEKLWWYFDVTARQRPTICVSDDKVKNILLSNDKKIRRYSNVPDA